MFSYNATVVVVKFALDNEHKLIQLKKELGTTTVLTRINPNTQERFVRIFQSNSPSSGGDLIFSALDLEELAIVTTTFNRLEAFFRHPFPKIFSVRTGFIIVRYYGDGTYEYWCEPFVSNIQSTNKSGGYKKLKVLVKNGKMVITDRYSWITEDDEEGAVDGHEKREEEKQCELSKDINHGDDNEVEKEEEREEEDDDEEVEKKDENQSELSSDGKDDNEEEKEEEKEEEQSKLSSINFNSWEDLEEEKEEEKEEEEKEEQQSKLKSRNIIPLETIEEEKEGEKEEEKKEEQSDNNTIDDLQQLLRKELDEMDFSIGISQSLEDEQNQTSTADRKFDFVENIDDLHNQLIEEIRESNHFFTYDTCKSVGDAVNIESSDDDDDDDDDCDFVRFEVIDNKLQQVSKRKLDKNPLDELFELSNLKFKKSD